MQTLDRAAADRLLTTTRAVRRRLDLSAPVDDQDIRESLAVAVQAPTGNSAQDWRFVVVTDAHSRARVGELYGEAYRERVARRAPVEPGTYDGSVLGRVRNSSAYLAQVMGQVPVLVLACLETEVPPCSGGPEAARFYASIYPAVWNLQLALRVRGYGSCLTTVGLGRATQIGQALDLPSTWNQCALMPVARTLGSTFSPAPRSPLESVVRWV
ncbi:nitroreductase family protein [uncultured Serinicoccus sp.]|uniref:nitroreductase family protein n=1 Tax=uncultured Serinicoccus sp. TaxID=735514 RepID=UPI002625501E|nr:nitroreductase family protein [uncultured Serinicoccus sp.]